MSVEERQVLLEALREFRAAAARMGELVDVVSGSGVTVPRTLMLSAAEPFRTFKADRAEEEFHAIRVDNFSTAEVDVRFDGQAPTQANADERVPPLTGRIIVRPYSVASVGFDPAVAPSSATAVRVTYYSRALAPATYNLDAGGGLVDSLGNALATDLTGDGLPNGRRGLDVNAFDQFYNPGTSGWEAQRTPSKTIVVNSVAVGTEATIWTPASGKKFRVLAFLVSVDAGGWVILRDGVAGTPIFEWKAAANVAVATPPMGNGKLSAAANNPLTATLNTAGNMFGTIIGTEE